MQWTSSIVAHPNWIKFNPRIREICEPHLRQRRLEHPDEMRECLKKAERYAKHMEDIRLIGTSIYGNKRRP